MRKKMVTLLALLALCIGAAAIVAAPGSPADRLSIYWWTVDGGGRTSQGGSYALSGTAGQADAGYATGGSYGLRGGFWNAGDKGITRLYLPLIRK
jgi:hypothetical protein